MLQRQSSFTDDLDPTGGAGTSTVPAWEDESAAPQATDTAEDRKRKQSLEAAESVHGMLRAALSRLGDPDPDAKARMWQQRLAGELHIYSVPQEYNIEKDFEFQ